MSIGTQLEAMGENLRASRIAIIGRGGEISRTAGLRDLPTAIYNIPRDNSLTFIEDEQTAYRRVAPIGVKPYALLKSLGGMTRRCENLIPYPYVMSSTTISGVTITILADGGISVSGTSTESVNFGLWHLIKGEFGAGTYTISGGTSDIVILARKYNSSGSNVSWIDSIGSAKSGTLTAGESVAGVNMYISSGKTVNATVYPMFNYGTTAKPYEVHFDGLRNAAATNIESFDVYSERIDNFVIPTSVQMVEGYGLGINATYYNAIIFDAAEGVKEFRAPCQKIVVDGTSGTFGTYTNAWTLTFAQNIKAVVADKYRTLTASEFNAGYNGVYFANDKQLIVRDGRFTNSATAVSILSADPVECVVAFDDAIVTDITQELKVAEFIEVEGGGEIIVENEYKMAAPLTIKYTKDTEV